VKTILLIIHHFFPRRRWEDISRTSIMGSSGEEHPIAVIIIQRDQFGDLRTFRIKH
jgi:hypothetical protein